jgi:hypothetical protein
MSRSLTAAQVIALGEYLDPDFDPSSLTVNQLLGVFGFHNIRYPTPYTKPKLVQLFNDEIKAKTKQLKKDRVKKENSLASDDGIKDGVTGRYLNEDSNKVGVLASLLACELTRVAPSPHVDPPAAAREHLNPILNLNQRRYVASYRVRLRVLWSRSDLQPLAKTPKVFCAAYPWCSHNAHRPTVSARRCRGERARGGACPP